MSEPLTIDQLKRVKKGTVLWAVLKPSFIFDEGDLREVIVRSVTVSGQTAIVNLHTTFAPWANFSTEFRAFYINYWDAYKAAKKR